MAKLTLLQITQSILNDIDGDEVNSIADTIESAQVAQMVKDTFFEIIEHREWPHLNKLIQLTPQGVSRPTHMNTDPTWNSIEWVKYNVRKATDTDDKYVDILYMTPKEFTDYTDNRKSSDSDVDVITDPSGVSLLISTDIRPTYWTTFDDDVLVFDSYDTLVDTNLQQSKTQCWGNVEAAWVHTDAGVPDLPAKAFSYLLSEAKSTVSNALRQVGNAKEEQKSRRGRIHLSREKWRVSGGMTFPDYGRK